MSPTPVGLASQWRHLSEEIMSGIEEWRLHHRKATRREIEAAVDERLAEIRTRMRQDVALASQAAEVSQVRAADRPGCPHYGTALEPRGPRERQVTTHQGKTLLLRRSYTRCQPCQVGLFPLDDEWALLPAALRRRLRESLVRLGTWMLLAQAAQWLAFFTG